MTGRIDTMRRVGVSCTDTPLTWKTAGSPDPLLTCEDAVIPLVIARLTPGTLHRQALARSSSRPAQRAGVQVAA